MIFSSAVRLPRPDVILFDLDDTFYDSHHPHEKAIAASLLELSKIYPCEYHTISEQYQQSRQRVKAEIDGTASCHSRLLYFQKTLESLNSSNNIHVDIALESLRIEATYWDTYLNKIEPVVGLLELISKISSMKIKMGIVTDLTASIQFRKLLRLGISKYFHYVVTSEEAGADKPNFNAFSLAREKCERFSSKATYWMVGDSPIKDLLGAKNELIATTFLVPSRSVQVSQSYPFVDYYIPSLSSLANFL